MKNARVFCKHKLWSQKHPYFTRKIHAYFCKNKLWSLKTRVFLQEQNTRVFLQEQNTRVFFARTKYTRIIARTKYTRILQEQAELHSRRGLIISLIDLRIGT